MSDGNKRIPISEEAFAQATEAKKEDETWSEYVQRCAENPPEVIEHAPVDEIVDEIKNDLSMVADPAVPEDDLVEDIAERVETMEGTVKEQTQTIQSLQKTLEDMR